MSWGRAAANLCVGRGRLGTADHLSAGRSQPVRTLPATPAQTPTAPVDGPSRPAWDKDHSSTIHSAYYSYEFLSLLSRSIVWDDRKDRFS
jgi:hypothetical protein